jgi:hypothetical protein
LPRRRSFRSFRFEQTKDVSFLQEQPSQVP